MQVMRSRNAGLSQVNNSSAKRKAVNVVCLKLVKMIEVVKVIIIVVIELL